MAVIVTPQEQEAIQVRAANELTEHLDDCPKCANGFLCDVASSYLDLVLEGSEE